MKKRILVLIILILAIAAGVYVNNRNAKQESDSGSLKIYGTVDIRDLSLAFTEQERLIDVLVEEGAQVTAGQILARLNSAKLETSIDEIRARIGAEQEVVKRLEAGNRPQEIDQARAEVEATQVQVTNSQQRISRLEVTAASGATSKQDIDDARALLRVEKAQLKIKQMGLNLMIEGPRKEDIAAAGQRLAALQANLELLNIRLADMTLKAPSNGIIQSRILEPGEIAGPQRPVLIMALNDPKWVRAYVSEQDLGRIELGQQAEVLSDSFPDQPVAGWVGFISPVAEFTPRAVQTEELRSKLVYKVRILVEDRNNRLRLGMPVSVRIDQQQGENQQKASAQSNPEQGV